MYEKDSGIIAMIPLDEDVLEERTISGIDKNGRPDISGNPMLKIEIFDREGFFIPHFHVTGKDNNVDCCICLAHPRFFTHGDEHTKRFTDKRTAKILDSFLRKEKKGPSFTATYWGFAVASWMASHPFGDNVIQPDYTKVFDNPYKMVYTSSVQKKSAIGGYTIYEGEIKDREFSKSIIVSNSPINNNSIKVTVLSVIEENFSNNEIFICKPKDDRVKVNEITSFSQDVANRYLRLKQYQFVSEKDYTG